MIRVKGHERLPLTCTREGTCCHGKEVRLNPWELAALAAARGMTPTDFRQRHSEHGVRLRFDGPPGWRGLAACSQYDPATRGCLAHGGRPLACRLYPLGRERRAGGGARYGFEGPSFPCRSGCPTVDQAPPMRVADYLAGQGAGPAEQVQDAYVELMQDLAEGAFVIAFDSGLAGRDQGFLDRWQALAAAGPGAWAEAMGPEWFDRLTAPGLDPADGPAFAAAHRAALQAEAQRAFAALGDAAALAGASAVMLALALLCAHGAGADASTAGTRWLQRAKALARR